MKMNIKTNAMVHSLGSKAEVTILEKVGDNQYIADYKGIKCMAIYNIFTGCYYVDDLYGVITEN